MVFYRTKASKRNGVKVYHLYPDCPRLRHAKGVDTVRSRGTGWVCYDCNHRKYIEHKEEKALAKGNPVLPNC